MKRFFWTGITTGVVLLASLGVYTNANAWSQDMRTGETVTVAKDTVHTGSLYVGAETVTIEGTVEGSLYCVGRNVTIKGTVTGDVACAGENVTYEAKTAQSVRLAGQNVSLKRGSVGADTTVFAGIATIAKEVKLAGDLNGMAQLLTLDGTVAKNLHYGASTTTLNGVVQGSGNLSSDIVTFGDDAKIAGDLHYSASRELKIDDGKVDGKIAYNAPEQMKAADLLGMLLQAAIAMAFAGVMLTLVAPRFIERSSQLTGARFGQTLLVGAVTVFVAPIGIVLLFLTGIGVPLAIVALLLYIAVLLLSGVFFAYYLGAVLLRSSQSILVRMIGGVAVLSALWLIPVVNIFAIIATVIVGAGILVRTVTHGYRTPRYSLADEPPVPPMPKALSGKKEQLETPKPIAKRPTKPAKKSPKKDKDINK